MLATRTLLSLVALGLLAGFATTGSSGGKHRSAHKRITTAQCKRLVKRLVYPGKPPFKVPYVFPEQIDERKIGARQRRIKEAYDTLSDNIAVSLPVLVRYCEDDRFSYVFESEGTSGVIAKADVGSACSQIIRAHVEVYRRVVTRHDFAGIPRCPSFLTASGGIKKWWRSRKGKSLAELQLEAIAWARHQKRPKLFESNREWTAAKKSLEKMAATIRESRKPILVQHHVEFFGK
jgi:hypothetical protein